MSIAILIQEERFRDKWAAAFKALAPEVDFRVWPELGALEDIDFVVAWRPPEGMLASLPNLKAIHSIGAGVNYIFEDKNLPNVPVLRVVDERLTNDMAQFVSYAVLNHFLNAKQYRNAEKDHLWRPSHPLSSETTVGILGLGEMGAHTANVLQQLHFKVIGYSRSPKDNLPFDTFHGENNLSQFLKLTDILVCLLPLTKHTENILNKDLFYKLKKNAYVINVGRGNHLVEQDLINAIDDGQLSGAFLDVFSVEPLPLAHPFWQHEKITITPHVASQTVPARACQLILANYARLQRGESLLHQVDLTKGY